VGGLGCGQSKKQVRNIRIKPTTKIPNVDFFGVIAGPRFALNRVFCISERAARVFSEQSLSGIEIRNIELTVGGLSHIKQLTVVGQSNPICVTGVSIDKVCSICGFNFFTERDPFPTYQSGSFKSLDFQIADCFENGSSVFNGSYFPKLIVSRRVVSVFEENKLIGGLRVSDFAKYIAVPTI